MGKDDLKIRVTCIIYCMHVPKQTISNHEKYSAIYKAKFVAG